MELEEAIGSTDQIGSKKRKLSPSDEATRSESSERLIPPSKQYPAALQAYDPKLYPDAASVIEAYSHTRPRHLYPPPPSTAEKDTPPVVGRTDTPPVDEGKRACNGGSHRGQRLERKNGKLGRTQTFVGL